MTDKEKAQAAKNYLSRIAAIDALIGQLSNTVQTLRYSLTSQGYALQPDKVQASAPKDSMTAILEKIVDYEADINRYIDELVDLKQEASAIIQQIPELDQRAILTGRYVNEMPWDKLANEMSYSVQHLYRIHEKALLSFFHCLQKDESL